MDQYRMEPDGTVMADGGQVVAFFDPSGGIYSHRGGTQIGFVDPQGGVYTHNGGQRLGRVDSDGSVWNASNQRLGHVDPPVHRRGALLLLLG